MFASKMDTDVAALFGRICAEVAFVWPEVAVHSHVDLGKRRRNWSTFCLYIQYLKKYAWFCYALLCCGLVIPYGDIGEGQHWLS